jgi:TonB family protein
MLFVASRIVLQATVLTAFAGVVSALPAQVDRTFRIHNPFELVLADSSEARSRNAGVRLKYPPAEGQANIEAAFAVTYVIDTTGRVERRSITFTSNAALPFRRAVCDYLALASFEPVIRDGLARRALVVEPFTFYSRTGGQWRGKEYNADYLRSVIRQEGIPETVPSLERQPHCED